jgi:hypothetical protein
MRPHLLQTLRVKTTLPSTVAILAQGTSWAVAVTQAFLTQQRDVLVFKSSLCTAGV